MQSPTHNEPLKVLLIEDDEDDFILTKSLFSEIQGGRFQLEWVKNPAAGLEALVLNQHDICLVDYRLGAQTGVEVLRAALERGCTSPIILLTGQGEHEIDLEAMQAGAADYLIKSRLDACSLERSIRYAVGRQRAAAAAAADQARLAAFGAEVGLALTRRDSLDAILHRCAAAMSNYLQAELSRIWTFDPEAGLLQLQASVGTITDPDGYPQCNSRTTSPPDLIAEGKPFLFNPALKETPVADRDWVKREGIVACAGYPLMLEERPVGLMVIYSSQPFAPTVLQEMSSVANGIALCVERKRSEEALGASEVRYRSVVESIKEVIFQVNDAGQWTFLNPAWTEITGFKIKESLGKSFVDYVHPEDRERHCEVFQEVIQRGKSFCRDETRFIASDGTFRWVEVYAQPTLGTDLGTSGTITDITERKRAEAEIRKLAAFPRFNPDPVLELASDGTLTYLNQAASEMALSLTVADAAAILPPCASATAQECLRTGQSRLRQEICINERTLSWSFFPILANHVVHCYGQDVTDRLNLEAQLLHAQRLESVGQLAAGVAHDFNNILTIIQGHADRLLGMADLDPRAGDPLKQVSDAASRAAGLTRQLLMFSRKQVMQPRVLDINGLLRDLSKMLHRLLGDDIALECSCTPEPAFIEGDAGMIEQVIMNFSVNARDAMPKGGRLLVATKTVQVGDAYAQQHPDARPGQFICLSVADSGCGMDRETLNRIYEPFFTTKPVGKGTGLGLATVYGIVKQHQGWLEVTSEIGVGTTFKVYLPVTTKTAEVVVEKAAPPAVKGGRETILLVEDEPVLRELAQMILKDYAYEVLEACSGVDALKVWEKRGGNIDLLLTDMVMPEGMTGRELADELRSRKPDLKVIYTSGYSADIMGRDMGRRDTVFLQKPYPPPKLAEMVRACLDK